MLQTVSKPLWVASDVAQTSFTKIKDFFVFKSKLISDNIALSYELESLKLRQVDYEILLRENKDLKSQLGRNSSTSRIISKVLSKPPQSPYDTFVIDVGYSDGVAVGNKVYLSDNIIIGAIANISSYTSVVELFSTGKRKQEVTLERTGTSFEVLGGGANLQMEVPKDTDILWGDVFMYPGFSTATVGSVYYIDTNSQSSFKKIYIRVPGNVFSSKWVFVERTL